MKSDLKSVHMARHIFLGTEMEASFMLRHRILFQAFALANRCFLCRCGALCRVALCHAISWLQVACHILAPYFGVSYSFRAMPFQCHEILTCLQLVCTWVQDISRNFVIICLMCPQIVGTWVQDIVRNVVPDFCRVMPQMLRAMACQYLACR